MTNEQVADPKASWPGIGESYMTDWANLMPDVAKALLGEPNQRLSKGDRWRYENKVSLNIDIDRGGGIVLENDAQALRIAADLPETRDANKGSYPC